MFHCRQSLLHHIIRSVAAKTIRSVSLEQFGKIIRLKRGLYVPNPEYSGVPLCMELIANHLCQPSYVSLQSALRFYGLIPERVYNTTSVTTKGLNLRYRNETYQWLEEDIRFDMDSLKDLDVSIFQQYLQVGLKKPAIEQLIKLIKG